MPSGHFALTRDERTRSSAAISLGATALPPRMSRLYADRRASRSLLAGGRASRPLVHAALVQRCVDAISKIVGLRRGERVVEVS